MNSSSLEIEGESEFAVTERDVCCTGGDRCNTPVRVGGETTSNGEPERLPLLLPMLKTSMLGEERTVFGEGGESRMGGEGGAGNRSDSDPTTLVFALASLCTLALISRCTLALTSRLIFTSTRLPSTLMREPEVECLREDLFDGARERTGVRTTGENGRAE